MIGELMIGELMIGELMIGGLVIGLGRDGVVLSRRGPPCLGSGGLSCRRGLSFSQWWRHEGRGSVAADPPPQLSPFLVRAFAARLTVPR